jgi:hypothetical protein
MKKLILLGFLALMTTGSLACSYAGVAAAPDGTIYVARNDGFLFGALRGIYSCKLSGTQLNCNPAGAP